MLLYCVCLALPFVSSDGLRPQPHGTVMYREECREDAECSTGKVCMAGKCGEEINVIDSGEKCNLSKDQCAPGFCCFKNQTLMFPVCVPLPVEGQQCRNQPSLLNLLKINAVTECESCNCPCAEGLVCTSRGISPIFTCEKPDEVLDFTAYREEPVYQPLVRRGKELIYYDSDIIPWSVTSDQLTAVEFTRAAEESAKESEHVFRMLQEDMVNNLIQKSVNEDEIGPEQPDPGQMDFRELKQIEQYFGPEFY